MKLSWMSLTCARPYFLRVLPVAIVLVCIASYVQLTAEEVVVEEEESETVEQPSEEGDSEAETPIEELSAIELILMRDPTDEDYEATVKCVNKRRIRNVEVLSDRFVLLEMQTKDKYLIQLKRRCNSIKRGEFIRIDSRTGRFCRGDSVRGTLAEFPGVTDWGAPCRVPGFEPINDVQLEQLKLGLASKTVE